MSIVDYLFFFQICSNFNLKMKRTGIVVAKSKKFNLSTFKLIEKQLFPSFCLPLSRQTNDNFGDFSRLILAKEKLVEFDLDLLEMALKIWPFLANLSKLSSLDFASFHGILPKNLKNKPFFLEKRIFFSKFSRFSRYFSKKLANFP